MTSAACKVVDGSADAGVDALHLSSSPAPKVTIGLAVYNGEEYLEECVSSILAQTFKDFELVICDNCSTDATPDICARLVASDPRVRYYRNPANIGGVRNENRTMFLARGEYFLLAAHDDRIAPRFLERCVAVLDSRPDVEVCTTGVHVIDGEGRVTEVRSPRAGTEMRPAIRIRSIASWDYACEATYGLMRTSALRSVRPQTNHLHSDRVMITELALRSPFHLIDEPLFYKRVHEGNAYKDFRGRMAWCQPELAVSGGIRLPHWLQALDYATMLARVGLKLGNRLSCGVELLRCFWYMRRQLAGDVIDGARMFLKGREAQRLRYKDESRWR